ncbi:MAG: DUF2304 domain-containing protein [Methanosphaera sp.]|nr:DUF2304 domain-containing protein [Methanosphaera sp.]
MLTTLHIILIILSILVLSFITYSHKNNTFSNGMYLFCIVVWIFIVLIALFPSMTTAFARLFGLGRGLDAIYILAILFLLYLLFKLYNRVEDQTKRINELVTQLALKDNRDDNDK